MTNVEQLADDLEAFAALHNSALHQSIANDLRSAIKSDSEIDIKAIDE